MMGELKDVKAAVKPTDTLLVVDAMTGQEAAGLVKSFHEAADLSGVPADAYSLLQQAAQLTQSGHKGALPSRLSQPLKGVA